MSVRSQRKADIKLGMLRTIGEGSSWRAHKKRSCLPRCWYCKQDKLNLFSRFWRMLKMPASMRHGDRLDKKNKQHQATFYERVFRNPMQHFRAKV